MLWVFYFSSLNMECICQSHSEATFGKRGKDVIVLWSWVGRSKFLLLMCLVCHFYRSSKQCFSIQWCLLLLLVLRESAMLKHHWGCCLELPTAWSVWLQSGLTVLCSTGTTWASPLVVIPVLCGNRIHPSNQDSLGLSWKKLGSWKWCLVFSFTLPWLTPPTLGLTQHGGGE